MQNKHVTTTIHDPDTSDIDSIWLTLEQEPVDMSAYVSVTDLVEMYSMTISGMTAYNYLGDGCPASIYSEGIIECPLVFYVWPSSVDLDYTIHTALGDIIETISVSMEKEFDFIIPFSKEISLPYNCSDLQYEWQTKAYDNLGQETDKPSITVHDNYLELDKSVFGVLRIKCLANGYKCTNLLTFDDTYDFETDSKKSITNVNETVTAKYTDEDDEEQSKQMEMDIPPCVAYLLEACTVGGDYILTQGSIYNTEKSATIYYSTCTGSVLEIIYE